MSEKVFSGANLKAIFDKKIAALYAFCEFCAIEALKEMQSEQLGNKYWNNETKTALQELFSAPFRDEESLGFFLAHGVEYGKFLELANDRQNAILLPKLMEFVPKINAYLRENFGAAA